MLIAFSANNSLKVKRNSNYQKWAHLLSFCCLTFVSTFITTRSKLTGIVIERYGNSAFV